MIPVTKPFLPNLSEYEKLLQEIWQRNWLTNDGPLVNELELTLKRTLGLNHLLFVSNGTIALQMALKALGIEGEVITTPFSYVATTSSIVWENCTPVYVDIDPNTFNIDPTKIEAAITAKTTAILATHVFGNACDIDAIEAIAQKHQLKVIYDAAHCFGTLYKGKSILAYGDISTISFHATKLFHTVEGGAVITQTPSVLRKLALLRNFGHDGPDKFSGIGINGKNSELHAAMGIINLRYIDEILAKRKWLHGLYDSALMNLSVQRPAIQLNCNWNYAYYHIVFNSEAQLLASIQLLNEHWVYPRRYFYPSLNTLSYVTAVPTPVSENIASRILCLPLYHEMTKAEVDLIARLLLRVQNN